MRLNQCELLAFSFELLILNQFCHDHNNCNKLCKFGVINCVTANIHVIVTWNDYIYVHVVSLLICSHTSVKLIL